MSEDILVSRGGGIARIRLNRPERRNALTHAMYEALTAALEAADADPAVQCTLLSGAGDLFCAGNDVKEFLSAPPDSPEAPVFRFLQALHRHRKILVAAVNGPAVGIGTTMLLHCDLVLATERTTFLLPFVNLAIVPEAASSLLLPRLLGHRRAMEMLLLPEPIAAARAVDYGWVNRIVPADSLDGATEELLQALLAKPPQAVLAIKALLKSETAGIAARIDEEARALAACLSSDEGREAVSALLEKRPAQFARPGATGAETELA